FLDLVPAGVGDFVAQVAQLSEVAAQRPLRHARAFGELQGIQSRLGDDSGQDPQQPRQPLSAVHDRTTPPGRTPSSPVSSYLISSQEVVAFPSNGSGSASSW